MEIYGAYLFSKSANAIFKILNDCLFCMDDFENLVNLIIQRRVDYENWTYNLEFLNQAKNIPVALPSFPIKIWGK